MSKKETTIRWLKGHRDWQYQQALGKLLQGKADPEYVERRWNKLKAVQK